MTDRVRIVNDEKGRPGWPSIYKDGVEIYYRSISYWANIGIPGSPPGAEIEVVLPHLDLELDVKLINYCHCCGRPKDD